MKVKMERAALKPIESTHTVFARAQTAYDRSDLRQCIKHANIVLNRERDHLGSWELVARSQWRLGEFEQALGTLDRLISLNPFEPGYFYLKGMILQGLGKCGLAIEAMNRCLAFTDSPVCEQAIVALKEIEIWQHCLIQEALAADSMFRIEYSRNPAEACQKRGFRIVDAKATGKRGTKVRNESALLWTRIDR